jgi:hypothetical protein
LILTGLALAQADAVPVYSIVGPEPIRLVLRLDFNSKGRATGCKTELLTQPRENSAERCVKARREELSHYVRRHWGTAYSTMWLTFTYTGTKAPSSFPSEASGDLLAHHIFEISFSSDGLPTRCTTITTSGPSEVFRVPLLGTTCGELEAALHRAANSQASTAYKIRLEYKVQGQKR